MLPFLLLSDTKTENKDKNLKERVGVLIPKKIVFVTPEVLFPDKRSKIKQRIDVSVLYNPIITKQHRSVDNPLFYFHSFTSKQYFLSNKGF